MKKFYSLILLFSFLVGTLQPILPMIEYQLHEGSIIALMLQANNDSGKSFAAVHFSSGDHSATHKKDHKPSLINLNFYPLGIATSSMPAMVVFPNVHRFYPPTQKNISNPAFLPAPPPPRLS